MPEARILIVEDENIVAKDIQQRLRVLGYYIVAVASSGEEALVKVVETSPDLVLVDIRLKGRMDGVETAEELRRQSDIPVVYLTASADHHTLERAKAADPFGYILEPFEERELYTCIEVALHKHQMEQKLRQSELWLSTTLLCIGDAVMATDKAGCVKFLNPVAEELTRWKQADAIERNLPDVFNLLTRDNLVHIPLEQIIRDGQVADRPAEAILLSKDGSGIPIEYRAVPIRNDHNADQAGIIVVFRDITERKQVEEKLRYLRTHDVLTGLYNRAYLEEEMARLEGERQFPVSIIIGDIDRFKAINDAYGHTAGDQRLRDAALIVKGAFRAEDVVTRIGGDEFAVLLPMTDAVAADEAVARIRQGIAAYNARHTDCPLAISLGVATARAGPFSEASKKADERMHEEKLLSRRSVS